MKVVLQRVSEASVTIEGHLHAKIHMGLLVLAGFEDQDTASDLEWIAGKLLKLRIFNDSENIMNHSIQDVSGEILVVSQFTLHASTIKGNRPSYIKAAKPEIAIPLYTAFLSMLQAGSQKPVQSGVFGAEMKVHLVNEGPVTILMDSKNRT